MDNTYVCSMKSMMKKLNDVTFNDYFVRLMMIARSVFKWENLPNGINEKWIEKFLFYNGSCVFFEDKTRGFMVANCTNSGKINSYDEPTRITPTGIDYIGRELQNNEECVLIDNNDLRIPTFQTLELYAYRLAELTRTIDTNVKLQKTPYIVLCNDKQRLSIKKVLEQVNDNEIAIYGDKTLDIDSVKVLKTDAPIVFPDLQIQKHAIWNEAMTFLGVNNANQDKKERLVTDEVSANDEQIQASAEIFLKSREDACKRINELFKLDISVQRRKDIKTAMDELKEGA